MRRFFLALIILTFLSGCGYHIAGRGGAMPGGVTAISIPVFRNNTKKPEIESIITSAFTREFSSTVNVSPDAGVVLRGAIVSYGLSPVSYTEQDVVQEYRLTVTVSLVLEDEMEKKILWKDKRVVDYEDFVVDPGDVTATEEAEIRAFEKLSFDMARLVKERMLENF